MSNKIAELIETAKIPFTKLEQRVANYMINCPEALAFETSAEIAKKLDVSPMTVSRFFKRLGFQRASEVRNEARRELYGPKALRIGDRYKSFAHARKVYGTGRDYEVAEAGIKAVFAMRNTKDWQKVIGYLADADSVAVVGFQVMQYLAAGFSIRLNYVRPKVLHVTGDEGVFVEIFSDNSKHKTLVLIDTFRYASNGPILAKVAKERGYNIVLICDEFCDWGQQYADVMLTFPNEGHFFLPLPVGIHFGLNLLFQDLIDQLGDSAKTQVENMSRSQELFNAFLSN